MGENGGVRWPHKAVGFILEKVITMELNEGVFGVCISIDEE